MTFGGLMKMSTALRTAVSAAVCLGLWLPASAAPTPVAACLPPAAAAGSLADACAEVQPGGRVKNENSAGPCTLNFMFSGSDGSRYIATAGHCLYDEDAAEPKVWKRGKGPEAHDGDGRRIGEYAFWTEHYETGPAPTTTTARDMALIRLDPKVGASPQLVHFGGPTGMNADVPTTPVILNSVGNGEGPGYIQETGTTVTPARTFIALGMPDPELLGVVGYAGPGDSGSPVTSDDGRAVGLLVGITHVGDGGSSDVPDVGTLQLVRLPHMIAFAENAMRIRLTLMTAALR